MIEILHCGLTSYATFRGRIAFDGPVRVFLEAEKLSVSDAGKQSALGFAPETDRWLDFVSLF
jgi:hypothetical protein